MPPRVEYEITEFGRSLEKTLVLMQQWGRWPGDEDYAGIDIFRFDDEGKIVEHWDVLQVITGKSKNDNGLF